MSIGAAKLKFKLNSLRTFLHLPLIEIKSTLVNPAFDVRKKPKKTLLSDDDIVKLVTNQTDPIDEVIVDEYN
ncbi:hypothetical protein BpHYR1_008773 [Brachionus plicatilis]|uniref:Uncharacterized protein n=1 Tax=Brachionus plicatilis TaxID=10195 RepID=A0A3M7PCT2_BRAPC|nr:hypothetical protein BpHYR1_008773 [Brachionus plicatilis]